MKNRDKRSIGTNRTFNSRYTVHEMQQRKMLRDNLSIVGTRYVGNHRFSIGSEVPIYEIESMHALNQIA